MKTTVPTLTALITLAAVGVPAFGASIADDLVIKPKAQIQVRAQFGAAATDDAGEDRNLYNGAQGDTEAVRFSVRRARFGAEAKNSTGWYGVFQIRAGERVDAGDATTSKTRTAELYYANLGKVFKQDGFEIDLHGGLDKPFNGESSISSSAYLLPMDRPNAHFIEYRDVGAGVKGTFAEMFRAGIDVQNGSTALNPDADSDAAGLFTSLRVEVSPGKAFMPAKKMESFAGSEGHHLVIGFDYQSDGDALSTVSGDTVGNDQVRSRSTMGPDILYHLNGLTALADWRMRTTGASPDDVKAQVWTIQAGYAFPLEAGFAIEPAVRFSMIDLDKDVDDEGPNPFNQGEYRAGQSGEEFSLGLNAYWNGHANKTQLAYTSWKSEGAPDGEEESDAHIITLQHQVTF